MTLHRGRGLIGGRVTGAAAVCTAPISGWGGIDPSTGTIIETRHPQRGLCFAGKILVIPGAKGSSGWSGQFHLASLQNTAPIGVVFKSLNTKLALGLVVLGVPAITDLDFDVVDVVRPGQLVTVDADVNTLELHPEDG